MSHLRTFIKRLAILSAIAGGALVILKWPEAMSFLSEGDQIIGPALYVSPGGDDQADGSKAAPLATVGKALELLPLEGGTIVLAGGVYTESFEIESPEGSSGPVVIKAARDQRVVFEGGQKLPPWKLHSDRKNVYVTEIRDRQGLYQADYLDFWDEDQRIRYGKMADAASVEHWPGTITSLEGDKVLFRPSEVVSPDELNLWVNRRAEAIAIKRSNVTLERLHFQNYLGGNYARAVTISSGENAVIKECTFTNCTAAIRSSADALSVLDSQFREVGTGVIQTTKGRDLTVRGSVFECATGQFAFSDVDEHTRNGIRIYHKADGAIIEECVTSGFWAGLYIKTISAEPGSRPYTIRNNTFLDGVRSGYDHRHPRTTITQNIIGTPSSTEAAGRKAAYFAQMGATLSDNLFIGDDAPETRNPFSDIAGGDLTLRPGFEPGVGATTQRKVHWSDRMKRRLRVATTDNTPAVLVGKPVVAASGLGAVISANFTRPVTATLRYRIRGSSGWQSAAGGDNTIRLPRNMIAFTPFEPWEPEVYSWSFSASRLTAAQAYEFQLDATDESGKKLPSINGTFNAIGSPKQIYVSSGAEPEQADGTEQRPFAELQPALDRALPGDTIFVGPGFYSRPAILRHGGLSNARITIEGAGWDKTIWDGGKRFGTLLELQGAPYVSVRGIQFRWFGNRGLSIHDSPGLHVEECRVWNHSFTNSGNCAVGVWMEKSPESTITRSLFNRLQSAVIVHQSPGLTFTHNTAMGNLYSGLDLRNSARNSVVTHNSLTFTGNRSLFIEESDRSAFDSLRCDFNNYGNTLRKIAPKRPENDFQPSKRYGALGNASKGIVAVTMGSDVWRDFHTMADWRTFSSKDLHSLHADPQYADPTRQDLRLLPSSPNLLSDGTVIGALPVVERGTTAGK